MSFKENLVQDAVNCFLNDNEFAQEISYTPNGGDAKTIKAVIVRSRIEPGEQGGARILQNQCEVYVANDATYGVTSVNKGDDLVSFPEIEGGEAIDWIVLDILSKSGGMWKLLVQK